LVKKDAIIMDEKQLQHLKNLRQIKVERLFKLEEQAAFYGIDTRPQISMEIDQLRAEIDDIDRQLMSPVKRLWFWVLWVFVYTFAGLLTRGLGITARGVVPGLLIQIIAGIIAGSILGFGLWSIIGHYVQQVGKRTWIMTSIIGWLLGSLVYYSLSQVNIGGVIARFISGAFAGLVIGFGQQIILHHRVRREKQWMWWNAAVWGAGGAIFPLVALLWHLPQGELLDGFVTGLVRGVITGILLLVLLLSE
jgi:hypothetical protein